MLRISAMIIIVFNCFYLDSQAQISGFLESQNLGRSGKITPAINIYANGSFSNSIGWFGWSSTSRGWSEGYVGPTFSPASWLSLSASLGVETADRPTRYSCWLWAGDKHLSFFLIQEDGGSGYWYRCVAKYIPTKSVSIGLMSERFTGIGPYMDVTILPLTIWGSMMWENGERNSYVSLRMLF